MKLIPAFFYLNKEGFYSLKSIDDLIYRYEDILSSRANPISGENEKLYNVDRDRILLLRRQRDIIEDQLIDLMGFRSQLDVGREEFESQINALIKLKDKEGADLDQKTHLLKSLDINEKKINNTFTVTSALIIFLGLLAIALFELSPAKALTGDAKRELDSLKASNAAKDTMLNNRNKLIYNLENQTIRSNK